MRKLLVCLLVSVLISTSVSAADDSKLSLSNNGKIARVVIVHDPAATDAFRAQPDETRAMVNCAITNLTGAKTVRDAWRSFVSPKDVVGIKVLSAPGPNSGTRPAVVASVIEGLLASGVPPKRIIVWDRSLGELKLAGYTDLAKRYGIRLAGSSEAGYDSNAFYDTAFLGTLVWGDLEFGKTGPGIGRKSFVTKLLTRDITKIISITPLLNHRSASVAGNLYGLAVGSVDNVGRFESAPERLATAVPEIYAMTNISDHVALSITDALICQYEGGEKGLLHYSAALNEIRVSQDPVALDALSINELENLRKTNNAPTSTENLELYQNASLLELGICDTNKIRIQRIEIPKM